MTEVIIARPPNFADIVKVFPMAANRGIIFAFNDAIYNPSNIKMTPALVNHEKMHLLRQGDTPEQANVWWASYLTDPEFRYIEELWAHKAEYIKMVKDAQNRGERRRALKIVASKLAAPLYGRMVSAKEAAKDIKDDRKYK